MKKEWMTPEITCLDVEETRGGWIPAVEDNNFWSGEDLDDLATS